MAINFPNSPNIDDTHTVGDKTYIWNGEYWRVLVNTGAVNNLIKDDDNDTRVQVEETVDDDTIRFYTAGTERYNITASGHLIPTATETYDLGSADNRFRDLYLSGATIDLGGMLLSSDGTSLSMTPSSGSADPLATETYVDDAISALIDTAPDTLNTLNELAAALNDDQNFATTVTDSIATKLDASEATVLSPPGSITLFAWSSAPSGWLLCQGQAVSRTTYAALFAVIGTTYGAGNGSTTFTVPNLKGRVPVGLDSGDASFNALGETGGAKTHTLTSAQSGVPAHGHTFTGTNGTTSANNRSHNHANTLSSATVASSTHRHSGPSHNHAQAFPIHPSGGAGSNGPIAATPWNTSVYGFGSQITYPNTGVISITGSASSATGYPYLTSVSGTGNTGTPNATTTVSISNADESQNHTHTITPSGTVNNNTAANASEAHNNLQPYIAMNYIIKV
jgi:microcystin-dependent protein